MVFLHPGNSVGNHQRPSSPATAAFAEFATVPTENLDKLNI
jgi:hypothetical protein